MSYQYADFRGNVVPFTGSFTLTINDNGKVFRCDDPSNVVVTVPSDLHTGFNVGFVMYNTGIVTLAAAPHAVNKSGKTALSTQYQSGSLMVMKRTGGPGILGDIEYLVGGDFA
ncbi:hypothetical protein [Bradyrhizobium arachidis]|uniref:Uncharacterized protein n=1 Tax=Bradyrhizobium arachidis TaxID=858423 RepID=A0AAE7NNJ1_9BRAD|nr:hypothetical protein [Bradyrhizobium arachidis]QOZ69193.1 hypothetical protein WN72_24860 [Bradyrhizobium arachidis]SFV11284.1 hypothetical protein SAMN05192541_1176 [Bradyrhizobium arachidis]